MQVDYGCHGYKQGLEFHSIDGSSLSEAAPEVTKLFFFLGCSVVRLLFRHRSDKAKQVHHSDIGLQVQHRFFILLRYFITLPRDTLRGNLRDTIHKVLFQAFKHQACILDFTRRRREIFFHAWGMPWMWAVMSLGCRRLAWEQSWNTQRLLLLCNCCCIWLSLREQGVSGII